jgi:hypothetical protein
MQSSGLRDGSFDVGLGSIVAPMRMTARLSASGMVIINSIAFVSGMVIVSRACLRIRTMMVNCRCGRIVSVRCAIAVIMWDCIAMLMGRRARIVMRLNGVRRRIARGF